MSRPRNPLAWYVAVSPEFDYVEPVVCGTGPTYTECDVCLVEAHTKREAQIRAVKHWRKHGAGYLDGAENPFAGVRVEAKDAEDDIDDWRDDDVVRYEQEARA